MTERNRKLFYEIADVIEAKPSRYYQGSWEGWYDTCGHELVNRDLVGYNATAPTEQGVAHLLEVTDPNAGCGSTFCIAGWAIALSATDDELKQAAQACVDTTIAGRKVVDFAFHDSHLCRIVAERLGVVNSYSMVGGTLLGLQPDERYLFDGEWQPAGTDEEDGRNDPRLVAAALRALADGASVEDVTFDPDGLFDDDRD